MQNATKSIFATLQNDFQSVEADQGLGSLGEWPPRGDHNCYVLDMNVETNAKFKEAVAAGGTEHEGISIQFSYQLVEDPDRAEPLVWRGAPITLPNDMSKIGHDGSKIRAQIELKRLKGHLKTLLGRDPQDMAGDMETVESMLSGDNSVVALVDCRYNTRNDRTYKTEHLKSLLSG